jgi:hypothetical protein
LNQCPLSGNAEEQGRAPSAGTDASRATLVAAGSNSRTNSSRFGPISTFRLVTPVTLPPGRFQAGDEPSLDRIDRNARRRRLRGQCRRRAAGRHNNGHLTANPFGRKRRQSIVLAFCPAIFDLRVLALDIARLFQPLAERA